MLFNSPLFVGFYLVVFLLYWGLRHPRPQNLLLIAASYVFYGTWSWKFLLLLMASTLIDFGCGLAVDAARDPTRRRAFLAASVTANLTLLGVFKYAGFFTHEAADFLAALGVTLQPWVLHIVLPVGLSFYTFQSLGYVIDVYRRKLPAVRRLDEYALYVAFFPQLVAGPIERATHMLPQYRAPRVFNVAALESGLMLMAWGLFKKMVIADNLAPYVNHVFENPTAFSGGGLVTAVVFFAFQIYCDFSGYSDCARGVARTLGFDLMVNFNLPYFSQNPVEFWRRWHISLSQWFQDYLYFPLAMRYMRRGGFASKYKAHIISFALIGLWHGANWTFIAFGLYWGLLIAGYLYIQERLSDLPDDSALVFRSAGGAAAVLRAALSMLITFTITCLGWLLFRADSLTTAWQVLERIVAGAPGATQLVRADVMGAGWLWLMVIGLWSCEWVYRYYPASLELVAGSPARRLVWRQALLVGILLSYFASQQGKSLPFIYFQF
jgi:D-alanyl-lipoteichoic acid acyltransferase DltB (MBOAT superfamily)